MTSALQPNASLGFVRSAPHCACQPAAALLPLSEAVLLTTGKPAQTCACPGHMVAFSVSHEGVTSMLICVAP